MGVQPAHGFLQTDRIDRSENKIRCPHVIGGCSHLRQIAAQDDERAHPLFVQLPRDALEFEAIGVEKECIRIVLQAGFYQGPTGSVAFD